MVVVAEDLAIWLSRSHFDLRPRDKVSHFTFTPKPLICLPHGTCVSPRDSLGLVPYAYIYWAIRVSRWTLRDNTPFNSTFLKNVANSLEVLTLWLCYTKLSLTAYFLCLSRRLYTAQLLRRRSLPPHLSRLLVMLHPPQDGGDWSQRKWYGHRILRRPD